MTLSSRAKRLLRASAATRGGICSSVVALSISSCDSILGTDRCHGADHMVIDMDTTLVYTVGQVVPLNAHVAAASGARLDAQVYWSAALPAIVTVSGATARAKFAAHTSLTVEGCGLSATMPFVANGSAAAP